MFKQIHVFPFLKIHELIGETKEEIKEDEQGEYHIVKGNWAWSLPVFLILAIIFLLLVAVCHLAADWTLLIVFLAYYLALVFHQLLIKQAQVKYSPFLPILVTVAVLMVYFICNTWAWWVWIVLLSLYILTLASYYIMVVRMDAKSRNYWWVVALFMTMLIGALLMVMRLCQCQEVIR